LQDIPVEFKLSPSVRLPVGRYGEQNLGFNRDYVTSCPAGMVFHPFGSSIFWFLPQKEFDEYIGRTTGLRQVARP
jgi:hypothetical protein